MAFGLSDDARSAALPLTTRAGAPPRLAGRRVLCDAALIGTWTWTPNRIGLDWFLDRVLPLLPEDFQVRVAGHVPAGLASRHPRVGFVGRVPDATQFVSSAAVVPLISRAGTGVQLKTIETFELGLPAVATTHSLRGIGFLPENCRVADDPRSFAEGLLAAARSPMALADGSEFAREQRRLAARRIAWGLAALGPPGAAMERERAVA